MCMQTGDETVQMIQTEDYSDWWREAGISQEEKMQRISTSARMISQTEGFFDSWLLFPALGQTF